MAEKAIQDGNSYIEARGLRSVSPKALNDALRLALDSMPVSLYGEATRELTAAEQAVLRRGMVFHLPG